MERHGPKAVFFGRWIAGLRIWASWLAGNEHMPWRTFLLWNALGGITWAICFGLLGYLGGRGGWPSSRRARECGDRRHASCPASSPATSIMHLRLRRRRADEHA